MIKEGHLRDQALGPFIPAVSDVLAEDVFRLFSTIC